MTKSISCDDLTALMASDKLFAVFDVRERGEYNRRQISGATSLPRSQIEFRTAQLVPDQNISIVLYDEGGKRAELAARTLAELGYLNVSVLEGGLPMWEGGGGATVSGVNVPSKAFGEHVQHDRAIPEITPEELKGLLDQNADLVICDVRTPEEYSRFCIPGGINVPGGDLILWADALRHKPGRTVVVNCAGRTRSIIGTAALRRLGLENVRALKNGTMGWLLAGLELETNPARTIAEVPAESREKAAEAALKIEREENIPRFDAAGLAQWIGGDHAGVSYLIDVRSEREYETGHIPGSRNVPGGQAVQRADDFIAVRNAQIIFISEHGARAVMAAYWYRQMGFSNVAVLSGGILSWTEGGRPVSSGAEQEEPTGYAAARSAVRLIEPAESKRLFENAAILDVGTSLDFKAAHVPGARWISRGWLEIKLPEVLSDRDGTIFVTCPDDRNSVFAARTLSRMGYRKIFVLSGGVRAWKFAGYSVESGLDSCLVEPDDVVLSPSITGDKEEMKRYLEWELKLKR